MKNPVFILSLSDTGYYTARLLSNKGILIYGFDHNTKNPGFFSNFIKAFASPNPLKEANRFFYLLLEIKKAFKLKPVLIPSSEIYLSFVINYKKELEEHFLFLMPSLNVMKKIINKAEQFKMAKNQYIEVPYYKKIYNSKSLLEFSTSCKFPIIIKGLDQLEWKSLMNTKGYLINSKNDLLERGQKILSSKLNFIAQEVIQGDIKQNFEFNALTINGKIIKSHVIRKIYQYPLGSGAASCVEIVRNNEVELLGKKYVHENNIEGFSNTEFKLDNSTGKYYFIETNARVWQQIELTKKNKQNYVYIYYCYLTNSLLKEKNKEKNKKRIWLDLPSFLILFIRFKNETKISLFQLIKTIIKADNLGIISFKDFKPFYKTIIRK